MDFNYTSPKCSLPPRVVGTDPAYAWQSAATGVAAASANLWSSYTGQGSDAVAGQSPKGKVWLELEATGFDAYVRLSRTATTGTTAANGSVVRAGQPAVVYFIDPTIDLFLDVISPGGTGTIKWRVCSQIAERQRA
jgi:hypothetical protein